MAKLFRILLSLCIFAVGLVMAAGMVAVSVLFLAIWSVRALCLKLAGRTVPPITARFVWRGRATRRKRPAGDVIDVEARHLP